MEMSVNPQLVDLYQICRDPAYVSLHPNQKQPIGKDWRNNSISPERAVENNKTLKHNIGILTGTPSGLVDVDLDCAEATKFAPLFLPPAVASFGHAGNKRGHHLVRVSNPTAKTQQFLCPDSRETLIELRADGSQTMIPPSVHPNGHKLKFHQINDTATVAEYNVVLDAVQKIAACSLVARNWSEGSRHSLALGFSGIMLKAGFDEDVASEVLKTVCRLAHDEDWQDRQDALRTTYQKDADEVSGYGILVDILGEKSAQKLCEWLNVGSVNAEVIVPQDNLQVLNAVTNEEELTETKMADAFSRWASDRAIYVHEKKHWYLWNGVVWQPDPVGKIRMLMNEFVSLANDSDATNLGRRFEDALRQFESLRKIKNTIELAQPRLGKSIMEFDTNSMIMAAGNTWIDLETGTSTRPNPNKLVSLHTDVRHDQNAECPVFENFLREVFEEDGDLISFIQRVVGYSLTGSNEEQCLFILNGDGANGKSTLINILSKLLGQYSRTAASHTLMANQREGVGDDLVHLVGGRMISVSETDRDVPLAEAKLKRLTGGDDITARALFGTYFTFNNQGKIFLATNNLPKVNGRDHGIFRRINIIPFGRQFEAYEQDKTLPEMLEAELSGILNWAIQGCLEWQQQGLNPPRIVRDQLDHYRSDLDTVRKYFEAQLVLDPNSKIPSSGLFQNYRGWCVRMGYDTQVDKQFKASMENIEGVEASRNKLGRYFSGVNYRVDVGGQSHHPSSGDNEGVMF